VITRLWMCGTQGTGKSTQVEYFHKLHPEFSTVNFKKRNLVKDGIISLNKKASTMDEAIIMGDFMLSVATTPAPFISERSFICKCAYSQCLPFSEELLNAYHIINTNSFFGVTENDLYIYFPPILELKEDGVRSMDPEYRKEVDYYIQFYLDYFQISYIMLQSYSLIERNFEIEQAVFGKIG
jgi:nicotinamide riboside kinase